MFKKFSAVLLLSGLGVISVIILLTILTKVISPQTSTILSPTADDDTSSDTRRDSSYNPLRNAQECSLPRCNGAFYETDDLVHIRKDPAGGIATGWPLQLDYVKNATGFILLDFDNHTANSFKYGIDIAVDLEEGINVPGFYPSLNTLDGTVIEACDKEEGCGGNMDPYGAYIRNRNAREICVNQTPTWIDPCPELAPRRECNGLRDTKPPPRGSVDPCAPCDPFPDPSINPCEEVPIYCNADECCLNEWDKTESGNYAYEWDIGCGGEIDRTNKVNYEMVLAHLNDGPLVWKKAGSDLFSGVVSIGSVIGKGDQVSTIGAKQKGSGGTRDYTFSPMVHYEIWLNERLCKDPPPALNLTAKNPEDYIGKQIVDPPVKYNLYPCKEGEDPWVSNDEIAGHGADTRIGDCQENSGDPSCS